MDSNACGVPVSLIYIVRPRTSSYRIFALFLKGERKHILETTKEHACLACICCCAALCCCPVGCCNGAFSGTELTREACIGVPGPWALGGPLDQGANKNKKQEALFDF